MKAPNESPPPAAMYGGYVIVLLTVTNVFSYMDRFALSVLAPSIKTDLDLSDAQLGLLTGFAFFIFYAICGIPIARWADRGVRRNIIALSIGVWSVMTAMSGAAQSFGHLFLARMGIGAGEAGSLPAGQSMLCDYVPLRRRSGVFAIYTFGGYAGTMAGIVLASRLGEILGWRLTFVALGLPGIAFALLVRFTLREPARGTYDGMKTNDAAVTLGETLAVLWRCKTYRLLALASTLGGFVQMGMNQWWPSFYTRIFHLSASSMGTYLGVAIGGGSAIGLLAGGLLANKGASRDIRLPLTIGAIATALALPVALASLFFPSASGSMLLVSVMALLWGASTGPMIATANSVVTPRMRATAASITIFVTSLLGLGLGPFSVGLLSDVLAPAMGVESLRYALLLPVGLLPVMAFVLYSAAKALPKD